MNVASLGLTRSKADRRRYKGLNESTMRKLDRLDSAELRELARDLVKSGADPIRLEYVTDCLAILDLARPPYSPLVQALEEALRVA